MLGLKLVVFATNFYIGVHLVTGKIPQPDSKSMSLSDASFCNGRLRVTYPELDIKKCLIVPREQQLREMISERWGAPLVRLKTAEKGKKYVLMMVDPDAPSRSKPTRAYWRHWLVVNVKGDSLRRGEVKGTAISEYSPPSPPQKSGLHRYQFMVYGQPSDKHPSLSKKEKSSLGGWDPHGFTRRFGLGEPVAAVQFLTQNHGD